jgi:uncharacterized protein DUF4375
MLYERVQVVVDDGMIAAGNLDAVIHPVHWIATIYDGPAMYEKSLRQFTHPQRLIWALNWYIYEVENGGHKQFYSNSTGIVWRDAMEGFEAIGVPKGAEILAVSAQRLGGQPSLDRSERQEQLKAWDPDFEDLDEEFGELEEKVDLEEQMMAYVQSRPAEFHFSGIVERVALPS